MEQTERKKLIYSFLYSFLLVAILWVIKGVEEFYSLDLSNFGIYPRTVFGMKGILATPFIHGDWKHLIGNSIPLLVLLSALFYFYRKISFKTLIWIYLAGDLWTWAAARPSYHIGASGIVYGLIAFLFFSGLVRKHRTPAAISMFVVFAYGYLVWGIFPIEEGVSWEGHLWGAAAGAVAAFYFRNENKHPRKKYSWEIEEEEYEEEFWKIDEEQQQENNGDKVNITYHYHRRKGKE